MDQATNMDQATELKFRALEIKFEEQERKIMEQEKKITELENFFRKQTIPCTKISQLKDATSKLLTKTTIHGIPRMVKSRLILVKFIWIVTFILSSYYCFDLIRQISLEYYKYDKINQAKWVNPKDVEFPAVFFTAKELSKDFNYQVFFIQNQKTINETFLIDQFQSHEEMDCLRFNGITNSSMKPLRINSTGRNNKLLFVLNNITDYIQVYIGDNYINAIQPDKSYKLVPQNSYNIELTKTVSEKLEEPHNHCTNTNSEYRKANCWQSCIHLRAAAAYKCFIPGYYRIKGLDTKCNITEVKQFAEICDKECIMECKVTVFGTTLIKNDINHLSSLISRDSIHLEVYFSELDYLELTEIPKMTFSTFVSAIGGHLSLFIGFEFLTVVELVEYFIDLIYIFFRIKKCNKVK